MYIIIYNFLQDLVGYSIFMYVFSLIILIVVIFFVLCNGVYALR